MKRYELEIPISDEKYTDNLIIALVRQGYAVYYNKDDKSLYFEIMDEDLQELGVGV